jgi:stringent starvation protein B
MNSSRPYLLRALLDWICDNALTPHLLVDATVPAVVVPTQFVQQGKITLNIGPNAVQGLDMGNDAITFSARFAGQPMQVYVPVAAVLAIFARENGQGMMFGQEPGSDSQPKKRRARPAIRWLPIRARKRTSARDPRSRSSSSRVPA